MATVAQLGSRVKWFAVVTALAVLSGCGGGGDNNCVSDPSRNPLLPGCASTPTTPTGQSSITLTLTDLSGNSTNTISPTSPGIVRALVRDTNGNPAPNVAVTFTTSDTTGGFSPASGSALTDSNGVAQVTLLAGTVAGAFTVTATTAGTTTGTVITIGPNGTIIVSTVSAGSATLGYAVNVPNLPASALGSIKFIGATTTNIALKGTGGIGRQEFSTLTFQVFDQTAHPVAGTQVNFTLNTTVGGLALLPQTAFTGANGQVSTVVSAGTVPTPIVIVTASIPNTGITTVSNVLVISTGLAVRARLSVSTAIGNFEGWEFDACPTIGGTTVSMSLDDKFGNPVPDGTAVSFTAGYGNIQAACLTGDVVVPTPPGQTTNAKPSGIAGKCGVDYCSGGTRPPGGRAVVMGFLRGEEDFFDANGNNVCDNCTNTLGPEFTPAFDISPDIFRDDNENGLWTPGEPCIGPNTNALCSTPPDGLYNGVLANPKIPDAQQTTYLGRSYVAIWSGSHAFITAPSGVCAGFSPGGGGSAIVHVRIVDLNGNPMPAGTTIVFSGPDIAPGALTTFTVANYVIGIGQQFGTGPGDVVIEEYDIPVLCTGMSSFLNVVVTTPRGVVTRLTIPLG
ncbi:MAG TPA: Ig-like domain-containing protein [Casimicrobiaceae bacterium]|jgi:protocatechuate 3,4-dioxygenase beta subunit|nr:Ig-like domain-containing protein [Casimicrobiaceae bacterium]